MTMTRDAANVIEKLNVVRQHELADETTVEALKASGTSTPNPPRLLDPEPAGPSRRQAGRRTAPGGAS
jgi:hypothetical protein